MGCPRLSWAGRGNDLDEIVDMVIEGKDTEHRGTKRNLVCGEPGVDNKPALKKVLFMGRSCECAQHVLGMG